MDQDKNKAIESLTSFLEAPKQLQVSQDGPDLEGLSDDLEVSRVASGLTNDKLIGKLLTNTGPDGSKLRNINNLSLQAFEDLYQKILAVNELLNEQERDFILGFISEKIIRLARTNFYMYVRYMAPNILPEGFIDGRHIKLMATSLQKVEQATYR